MTVKLEENHQICGNIHRKKVKKSLNKRSQKKKNEDIQMGHFVIKKNCGY